MRRSKAQERDVDYVHCTSFENCMDRKERISIITKHGEKENSKIHLKALSNVL